MAKKTGFALKEKVNSWILFMGSFAFYLFQIAPSVTAGDSGEFMTGIATLSLPHAPSFPFYILTGRCFIEAIPFGSIPYRVNLFSAFTSAAALVFCYQIAREWGAGKWMSLFISLLVGTSASFWANSLVAEVFSLNILLVTFLIWILAKAHGSTEDKISSRYLILFAFVMGLGLGNHQILMFILPGVVLFVVLNYSMRVRARVGAFLLFTLLGLSIYLALSIRAAKEPPLNWGRPVTANKLYRTITRKDYGSLRLALGESPKRNFHNFLRHLNNFTDHLPLETSWPLVVLAVGGFIMGFWRRTPFAWVLLVFFACAGPLFYLLGNLPFDAQSAGIIGRFFIMPVVFLILAIAFMDRRIVFLLPILLILQVRETAALGWDHRSTTLVLDYGRSMLRSMPPRSILFMDGGDDAFYSLAMLHYVMNVRPDVQLQDRGGLVFKNIYGDDFRQLDKPAKTQRRRQVEMSYLGRRPVFYSTMDSEVLPGITLVSKGFLYEAGGSRDQGISWPLLCLRSLYPTRPNDYRTRALGAFFPYMRGKNELERNDYGKAIIFFGRAQIIGYDVDWLKVNLGVEYAKWGYDSLVRGRLELAEWIYERWIQFDPNNIQAQSNLGVVYERAGRIEDAKFQYKKAAQLFPDAADPVFNLAVLAWNESDWVEVIRNLEEVLRRQPTHEQARQYLQQAKQKINPLSL